MTLFVEKLEEQATILRFAQPMKALSWAPWQGGMRDNILTVANLTLVDGRALEEDEVEWALCVRLYEYGIDSATTVAMITAVPQFLRGVSQMRDEETGLVVSACATVGLSNLIAPGDCATYSEEMHVSVHVPGTINIMVVVNRGLVEGAHLELVSIITETKAAFMADLRLPSPTSGQLCLGTGTDCVICCVPMKAATKLRYAGLHTRLAEVTALAVKSALAKSLQVRLRSHVLSEPQTIALARSRFLAEHR